jgi:4-hydroxy-tetrahydrodipicolinate synthase
MLRFRTKASAFTKLSRVRIPINCTSGYFSDSATRVGASARHGEHHDAHTFTTATRSFEYVYCLPDKVIPVIAGAGSNNTAEGLSLMRHAEKVGATAALVVTPYYNKPTQAGLKAHFLAAADCGMDIIIYNIPGRSAVDMSVETMGELAAHKHIIGVKDATGDLSRVPKQRLTCGEDFVQLSGEDATALGFNAHGGIGCISVTANMAPALCAQMQEATLAGDYATALKITDKLMPLHLATFQEPGLVSAKYGLSKLGLCTQEVRSPLVGLSDTAKSAMDAALRHAGLIT